MSGLWRWIVAQLPSTWNLCLWSHLCQFNIREYDINTYSYFSFIPLDFCLSLNLFYPVKFVWKRFVFLQKRNLKIQGIFWRFSFFSPSSKISYTYFSVSLSPQVKSMWRKRWGQLSMEVYMSEKETFCLSKLNQFSDQ